MTGDCPSTDIFLQFTDPHSDGFRDSECLEYKVSLHLTLIMSKSEFCRVRLKPMQPAIWLYDDSGKCKYLLRHMKDAMSAPCPWLLAKPATLV